MKIKNRNVEDGAIVELDVTHKGETIAWVKMHWTTNGGTYGHQLAMRWNDYRKEDSYNEYITGGWGFCKEQAIFQQFLIELLGKYVHVGGGVPYHLGGTKYHLGGNYYKVPLSVLKRLVK